MARAVKGDDHAYATVVRHYDRFLRWFTFQLLRDEARMDEVLGEAYIKAYRMLPAYRADTRPSTWLFRIVYNACMDVLRPDPAVAADGSRSTGPGELALWLDDALERLPPERRAAVLLVDGAGFEPAAAAEVLDVRLDDVRGWVMEARPALLAVIDAGGDLAPPGGTS
jgi:RNA polymerase sigma-70 factor (ECF subfamily)